VLDQDLRININEEVLKSTLVKANDI